MNQRRREADLFILRYQGEETEAVAHLRNVLPMLDAGEAAALTVRNEFKEHERIRARMFEERMCTAGIIRAKDCQFYGKENGQ